jgi:hypothetical protein
MKLTLRKANALQTSIQDAMKAIEVKTTVDVNEHQDGATEVSNACLIALTNFGKLGRLTDIFYRIRASVGNANAACGINELLASAACTDKRISQVTALASATKVEDIAVLTGKLNKLKSSAAQPSYLSRDTVTTPIFLESNIDFFNSELRDLKKEKQKINDSILELNIKTEITLSDSDTHYLTQCGLI